MNIKKYDSLVPGSCVFNSYSKFIEHLQKMKNHAQK